MVLIDYEEAVAIYQKAYADLEYPEESIPAPSKTESYSNKGIWYLRNCNGLIDKIGCRQKKVVGIDKCPTYWQAMAGLPSDQ